MVQHGPNGRDLRGSSRPRLVSVEGAAAYLGMGRRKLYGLMASGKIPRVLIPPRMRRLDVRDLDQFIEDNRQESI